MPSVLVVQHNPAEGPALLAVALTAADCAPVIVRTDRGDPIPSAIGDHAGLVVMGGASSAASDEGFPTRLEELALLADAVAAGVPTLGVCLGAQLLAAATGGSVHPGEQPEIGWAPVTLSADAEIDPLFAGCPQTFNVLHWHGETFHLPPAATHLAASASYRNQAFRVGDAAWGLQFHIEVDRAAVTAFVKAFDDEADHAAGGAAGILAGGSALDRPTYPGAHLAERFARLVANHHLSSRPSLGP